ncbi:RrF2 family transcriptional regulator [Deferribacteres bacterium DY0037]
MKISKRTEYGLHSVLYVAYHSGPILLDKLSEQGISKDYLAKVTRSLTKAGILKSSVGVSGGYMLARDPKDITFKDIFIACEGQPECNCAREHRKCDANNTCAIITPFTQAYEKMLAELQKTTIQDLLNQAPKSKFKLSWLKRI